MKRHILTLLAACGTLMAAAGNITCEVPHTGGWVFYSPDRPMIEVVATNNGKAPETEVLWLTVATDDNRPLHTLVHEVAIGAGESAKTRFSFTVPAPGFYRCTLTDGARAEIKKFNIGYEPEFIVSPGDAQPDLREFWDKARAELKDVAPEYELRLLPEKSTKVRNVYLVKMKSLGGETISGHYLTPTKKGKYPAIISYMGYGSEPWHPDVDNPDQVDFVLSVRGQGINQPENKYGDWITYGLDDKDNYYYRGAFMDLVRAIDFVSSRPEVRQDAIFAEGGSQGGAFTLAACALDDRICAAAPTIPFLSDYPDYFRIVSWPRDPVLQKQQELKISDADLYRTLSYFDIKNLAPWITCPIIMAVGLQDEICPPHTNFSGYNRLSTEKSYRIFPTCGHGVEAEWWPERTAFFKKHTK